MSEPEKSPRGIFDAALEIRDQKERAAFVERECAGDDNLLERVKELLLAFNDSETFMSTRELSSDLNPSIEAHQPAGTVIGAYKLLQEIGVGGFGVVYMAEQSKPVKRKVALKIIKPGMDTREIVARFEAERQALALMEHPNIAKVFDGGSTETGRPYFVMELVNGVPITDYCDTSTLSTKERLNLFLDVCAAIQHAHQKGVIHRDIKPSNVLITLHDGRPVPKVIDFGIAKAINQELTEKTLFTAYGQMIGTPLYTSPEQAEMSGLDIDTRADIYSLGVLLYELLTGETPINRAEIKGAELPKIQRLIREKEATKPSEAVSAVCRKSTALSDSRREPPGQLVSALTGDLDWIVLKALEKDRNRRYDTAAGFAEDVQRYLRNEPVLASPPTALYLLGKYWKRNRKPLTVAASIFAALLLGVVGMTMLYFEAEEARLEAVAERKVATQQTERAEREREAAETARTAESAAKQEAQATAESLKRTLARADFQTGLAQLEADKQRRALVHLARALKTDPTYPPTAPLLVSILRDLNHDLSPAVELETNAPVRSMSLNSSKDLLLAVCADGSAQLWDAGTLTRLNRFGADDPVTAATFSPDGAFIVTHGSKGTVRVWRAANSAPVGQPIRHPGGIRRIRTASPADGPLLIAALSNKAELRIWNGFTGEPFTEPIKVPDLKLSSQLRLARSGALVGMQSSKAWRIWDARSGKLLSTNDSGDAPPFAAALEQDIAFERSDKGRLLAGRRISTGEILYRHTFKESLLPQSFLTTNEELLVCLFRPETRNGSATLRAVDVATGRILSTIRNIGTAQRPLVDNTGTWCLQRINNSSIRLFNLRTGRLLNDIQLEQALAPSISRQPLMTFSPDGKRFALRLPHHAEIYSSETGNLIARTKTQSEKVIRIILSPTGERLATCTRSGYLRVWNAATGTPLTEPLKHSNTVGTMAFSPAEDRVYCLDVLGNTAAIAGGRIRVWDIRPTRADHRLTEISAPAKHVTFSPDGRTLAVALGRNGIQFVATDTRRRTASISGGAQDFEYVCFSPDGNQLASASDRGLTVWSTQPQLQTKPLFHIPDGAPFQQVAFSPDGKWLASRSKENVRVWDSKTGQPSTPPLPHRESVYHLAFRPDGGQLMSMTRSRTRLWKLGALPGSPKSITIERGRSRWTSSYSDDSSMALTTSLTEARIHDAASGKLIHRIPHGAGIRGSDFSPDGKRILTAIPNAFLSVPVPGTVIVWDLETQSKLAELGHEHYLNSAEFTPDGRHIVSACRDKTLRVWHVDSAMPVTVKWPHTDAEPYSFEISPDGDLVASVAYGSLRLLPLPFEDPSPAWLPELAEAVAREQLDSEGRIVRLDILETLKKRLANLPGDDDYSRFARWLVAERD